MIDPPMQPVLSDDMLLLRPLAKEDFAPLFDIASDREIWAIHPSHDRWLEPVFRAFFDEGLASLGALAAVDRATGQIIGTSRYDTRVTNAGEVEIGWTFLARSHWGGAWNARMKRLMLVHAFTRYRTALFMVGETNLRSRRALEKIGAVLTDRRHIFEAGGVPVDHLVYAITREGFAAGPLILPLGGRWRVAPEGA